MNAITIHMPEDLQEKMQEIAAAEGMSVDALLVDYSTHMIKHYEARKWFLEMKARGETEVDKALELLRR